MPAGLPVAASFPGDEMHGFSWREKQSLSTHNEAIK